ncbi:MAG: 16S rRNA (cytidine(1402)-2'-O)-methyltransferase [Candidatus Acidiferrales bacterium]
MSLPVSPKTLPEPGCLYLVSTPIGNLEDITLRALRLLREADVIACEDTRQTQKLLNHFEIRKRLVSYHEHNEIMRAAELVIELEQGAKVALVSDAGTPVLSDPGHHLVALCLRHRIPVIPIPGPSAVLAALSASGLPIEEFLFLGFLPARTGPRRKALMNLRAEHRAVVLYEAPHRIEEMLRDACQILGDRHAVLGREITKLHEEFLRGTLRELAEAASKRKLRGEITVVLAPVARARNDFAPGQAARGNVAPGPSASAADGGPQPPHVSLSERVAQLMVDEGLDHKAALKQAARERGLAKREAYRQLLLER